MEKEGQAIYLPTREYPKRGVCRLEHNRDLSEPSARIYPEGRSTNRGLGRSNCGIENACKLGAREVILNHEIDSCLSTCR